MQELCDLKVHVNGQHTFFIHQGILCSFSGRLRKMVVTKEEKKRSQVRWWCPVIKIMDFPGGPDGFELASRFCYSNGRIPITPANVCLLHCSALYLEMGEELSACNLLTQTETFMDGLFYWTWSDILVSLKSCEPFLAAADSSGLLDKLLSSLLSKISANSELQLVAATAASAVAATPSSSSCSSSPDTAGFRCSSSTKTPESVRPCFSRVWWFDDLTILAPPTIEKMMKMLGSYGNSNSNLILTRFLLHYLKSAAVQRPSSNGGVAPHSSRTVGGYGHGGLADTAVHGVALMGRSAFSCRGLFWVLGVVSGLGLSKDCRHKLERLMGLVLDQATLDDLLVSGSDGNGVYDVNLVLRLVRVFVGSEESGVVPSQRMRKVGRLIDKYLGEISPDQSLGVAKFLGVAESLPDSARDCYDGVYRALDIYLQSHPTLSVEDRTSLCRCLNFEKLSLEACKDFAKNQKIPPGLAVQALASQQSKLQIRTNVKNQFDLSETPRKLSCVASRTASPEFLDEKEQLRLNLQKMQSRVTELERACKEMKGQMSKMGKGKSCKVTSHQSGRGMPRLC